MARHLNLNTSLRVTLISLALLLSLLLLLPLMTPAPALATTPDAGWQSVPLTANFTRNEQPQIAGDLLVWRAYDGVDWEIMLYDLATRTTRQLTHDGVEQSDPLVDRGHVLWIVHDTTEPVLVLYDLADDTSRRVPQSEGVQGSPDMRGDLIAWRSGEGASSEIYLYDIPASATTRLTTDNLDHSAPRTDGRFVVFEAIPGSLADGTPLPVNLVTNVVLYDHQSKTLDHLGDGLDVLAGGAFRPQVAQGLVVWQRGKDKSAEIVLYDTATRQRTQLTDDNVEDVAPVVGGGKVAWLSWGRPDDMQMPHDSPWKTMLHDGATGQTTVVNENSLSVTIQDDGRALVWSYWGSGPQFVALDTTTGQASELEPGGFLAAYGAALDKNRVVWMSYAPFHLEDDTTIFLAAQDDLPPAAAAPTPPVREFRDIAGSPYEAAIRQLAERGIARGYRVHLPTSSTDLYGLEYRPAACTLRWQFLKMLLAIAGIDATDHTQQPPFKDVQGLEGGADHNLRYYVEAGLETGLMKGVTATRFGPFDPLTRAQAVTAVVRAAQLLKPESFDWLDRVSGVDGYFFFRSSLGEFSRVHAHNMALAEQNGPLDGIVGYGPAWDPWAPITRGEAAQLLIALAGKL